MPEVFMDNSDWTFTDTNPGIKNDHTNIKTIFTMNSRNKDHPNHSQSAEEDHKI